LKPAFVKRDKKETMIDIRGISTNWLKNLFCLSTRLSIGYGLRKLSPPYFTQRMRGKELLSLSSYFKKFL
jgi:hypothetical protein